MNHPSLSPSPNQTPHAANHPACPKNSRQPTQHTKPKPKTEPKNPRTPHKPENSPSIHQSHNSQTPWRSHPSSSVCTAPTWSPTARREAQTKAYTHDTIRYDAYPLHCARCTVRTKSEPNDLSCYLAELPHGAAEYLLCEGDRIAKGTFDTFFLIVQCTKSLGERC